MVRPDDLGQRAHHSIYATGALYEHESAHIRELRQTYHGVLMVLQQFIANDKYTQNHSYRVSIYAAKIAAEVGLDEERIEDIRAAALSWSRWVARCGGSCL